MSGAPHTDRADSGTHREESSSPPEGRPEIVDPDAGIVAACCGGQAERFADLVNRYKDALVNTIYRIVDDHGIAEDLSQDALVRAFTGLPGFRGQARFSTWLFGIGVNIARDYLRKKRRDERARDVAIDEATRRTELQLQENEPLDEAIAHDVANRFRAAFARLSADYRVAFALRVRDGLSYDEIADMTGVAPATLRMRVWRARESLREMMADGENEA